MDSDKALKAGLGCVGVVLLVLIVILVLGLAGVIPFGKPAPATPAPPPTAKITGLPWNAYLTCDALCNSPSAIKYQQQVNPGASELQGLPPDFILNNRGARSADGDDNFWPKDDSSCLCVADDRTPWESLAQELALVTVARIPAGDDTTKYASGTCDAYCSNSYGYGFSKALPWSASGAKAAAGSPIPSTARRLNGYPTCTCVPSMDPAHAFTV